MNNTVYSVPWMKGSALYLVVWHCLGCSAMLLRKLGSFCPDVKYWISLELHLLGIIFNTDPYKRNFHGLEYGKQLSAIKWQTAKNLHSNSQYIRYGGFHCQAGRQNDSVITFNISSLTLQLNTISLFSEISSSLLLWTSLFLNARSDNMASNITNIETFSRNKIKKFLV
jgi:hypothetical protein